MFVVLGAYALLAQVFTSLYFRVTVDNPASHLIALAHFDALRPYQYRVLCPAIVEGAARLLRADSYQYTPLYEDLTFLAVFLTMIAFRRYLALFLAEPKATLYSFALFPPLVLMHVSCNMYHYPSDVPATLFFVLALTAVGKKRWPEMYVWLALATLNRESAGMIVAALALTQLRPGEARLALPPLFVSAALFVAIQCGLHLAFAHAGGAAHEDHVSYNRSLIVKLMHGDPAVAMTTLFLACIPLALSQSWRSIPDFQRRLLPLVPLYGAGMVFVGILDEVRSYNEVLPILLAPLLMVFDRLVFEGGAGSCSQRSSGPADQRLAA